MTLHNPDKLRSKGFCLSDKIHFSADNKYIYDYDVKEFIKIIKQEMKGIAINSREKQIIAVIQEIINKIAGSKLTDNKDFAKEKK